MKPLLTAFILLVVALTAQSAPEQSHSQIARQNMPAIVAVNVLKKDGSTFTGTGFVLSEDGLIATNRHVLDNALYINITFPNSTVSGEAILLAHDPQDLALLKIEAHHLPHVLLGDSDTAQPGQTITVIGNPRRLQNTVTSGLISQIRQQPDGTLWHQISAPISPSSSGSPVFDGQGRVISIAFASMPGESNQNLNFAIPVNYLTDLIHQAGFSLPGMPDEQQTNAFLRHIQKSWEIVQRLWHRWFGKNPLENPAPNS